MNLLLHGLDASQIDPGNSLRFKLTDIGETGYPFDASDHKG
jgi:type I restriction enzyme M protein